MDEINRCNPVLVDEKDDFTELTEYICCQLYERNITSTYLASIVLDGIQLFIVNVSSFIYKLDFYSSSIVMMLTVENDHDKNFAQLIQCFEKLQEFNLLTNTSHIYDIIIEHTKNKKRTALVYQSLFNLILNTTNGKHYLDLIYPLVEMLLFQETDELLQWDKKDCALQFLIRLIKINQGFEYDKYPSWFNHEFLQCIIEKFVHHCNEYIQSSLINFLAMLIQYDFISPFDHCLTTNFIQLTQCSLGDIVRCSLSHAWYIILSKAKNDKISKIKNNHPFSFGLNTNFDSLFNIVRAQIPLLVGDGGHETEIQCLRLIELLGNNDKKLENILDFLVNDGCSNEIRERARRLLCISNDKVIEQKKDEILDDEFSTILHWFEHPDEHIILDCD